MLNNYRTLKCFEVILRHYGVRPCKIKELQNKIKVGKPRTHDNMSSFRQYIIPPEEMFDAFKSTPEGLRLINKYGFEQWDQICEHYNNL